MKFHFYGKVDVPNWLLSEVVHLAKYSSIRLKQICNFVIKQLTDVPYEETALQKHLNSAGLNPSEIHSALAVLRFIIFNSARFQVTEEVLIDELQQIGVPIEHSEVIAKAVKDNKDKLSDNLTKKTFRLPMLEECNYRVDFPVVSNSTEVENPTVTLEMKPAPNELGQQPFPKATFLLSSTAFATFLTEMEKAEAAMEQVDAASGASSSSSE